MQFKTNHKSSKVVTGLSLVAVYVWHEHKLEVAIRQLAPHLATPTTPKHCTVHDVKCTLHIAKCTVHILQCTLNCTIEPQLNTF